jgi:DNA polymerase III delta prime subunit
MQNINDLLKTQMVLQLGNKAGGALHSILALNVFEIVVKTFPLWSSAVRAWCVRRRRNSPVAPTASLFPRATITCERGVPVQTGNRQQAQATSIFTNRMDAVIHYVTTLPSMKSLLSVTHHDYLPHEYEPVCLENDIYFELQDLKVTDGQPEIIKFRLSCYEHDVQYLQAFIDTCTTNYERQMANKLGSHRYYFDQIVQSKAKGSMQNPLPTTHLLYTKSKFTTNRTFDNVFFEQRDHVRDRTKFFLERRDWYDHKGIPYTLGFMFHGPPGTGKTSSVKAIANVGRRHIINVQLSEIRSKQQLQHLFFNDEIHVYTGATTERYTIPVSERLYVIEDIDAMGDTVLRREWKRPEPVKVKKESSGDIFSDRQQEEEKEKIDLSFLLNLLDGTLEANGRILIITTNFPERIDRALIRPGRVDMIVHFKKCSLKVLREMVNSFYDKEIEVPDNPSLENKWTPAEVNQILFRNFEAPEAAIEELVSMASQDLYGFTENGTPAASMTEA